jgi:glycosyltransferase involved in cell wall biosynthesis
MSLLAKRQADESWAQAFRAAWRSHRYPLPPVRLGERQSTPPTVYFCAPDYNVPTGGIRVTYRHVDILNAAGIPAAVLHARPGFRCDWFENDTRVVTGRQTLIGPQDLIVVGELSAHLVTALPERRRFVVFNQGPHLTWRLPADQVGSYASNPDLAAIVTVSDSAVEILRRTFPQIDVLRVHNSIDPVTFHPDGAVRDQTIAYMPRRGRDDAHVVLGMLNASGALSGWKLDPIRGADQAEVGRRLRSATIFLSFAHQEGFGLPAAEAMASGAYVVGFHGFGGREYFRPEFSSPVAAGDVVAFAEAVETALEQERAAPGWCATHGRDAARFIADEYSPARERAEVTAIYSRLLNRQAVRPEPPADMPTDSAPELMA